MGGLSSSGWRGVPASSGGVKVSWGLVHEQGENGAGDRQTDQCSCRSNRDAVPVILAPGLTEYKLQQRKTCLATSNLKVSTCILAFRKASEPTNSPKGNMTGLCTAS
ncbi:hypothetical protein GOODEAATRI_020941 [Goodea atripinnis]|uniref:Uncharacterized protein n=1 Tax=Goodea atripinnis TaxID=208336 RepID=A0ABV0NWJ5_9TELE